MVPQSENHDITEIGQENFNNLDQLIAELDRLDASVEFYPEFTELIRLKSLLLEEDEACLDDELYKKISGTLITLRSKIEGSKKISGRVRKRLLKLLGIPL